MWDNCALSHNQNGALISVNCFGFNILYDLFGIVRSSPEVTTEIT